MKVNLLTEEIFLEKMTEFVTLLNEYRQQTVNEIQAILPAVKEEYYTMKQFTQKVHTSRHTVYKRMKEYKFRSDSYNTSKLFTDQDILNWVQGKKPNIQMKPKRRKKLDDDNALF